MNPLTVDRVNLRNLIGERASYQGLVFLLPTLAILSFILYIPFVNDGLLLSFKEYQAGTSTGNWVGLENYQYWLMGAGTDALIFSVKMTLLYEIAVISLELILGMAAALILNEHLPGRSFFRGLMIAGFATPAAAAAIIWRLLAHPSGFGGLHNFVTGLGITIGSGGMMTNSPWAFWIVVTAIVWRDFGFMFIIFLAGLQSVPQSLYEMAKVDGSGPLQRFRYITLPHLRSLIIIAVIIRTVPTISNVVIPLGLTSGGPNNYTTFIGLLIFESAFLDWLLGRAAALGMLLLVILVPLILLWVRSETEEYA